MAELLITEAVSQAEQAIESGNYDGAIETCQRILGQFPEFAAAHRILGDAYAEQGELESAKQAYYRTLERDPQSVAAHVGLGMIAEESQDKQAALAHFQVAWEIDPRRRDLREHVSRLSQEMYGEDGRLYLTRAALTSLHFYAGRWDRAVSEAVQVLQEYSSRVDVQVRMAEALWRRGDDEQAKQVASSILRSLPFAVVPLLILADIHRRESDESEAQELLNQARAIDPAGVRAADLIIVGLDDQADFLTVEDVPTIEESALTEEPVMRYAPAPDFSADTGDEELPDEDVARDDTAVQEPELQQPREAETEAEQTTENLQPFRWEDITDEDLEASDLDEALETPADAAEPESEPQTVESPEEESVTFELYSDEEIEQARPSGAHPSGFTGYLTSLDSEGMRPFDLETDEQGDLSSEIEEMETHPVEEARPEPAAPEPADSWADFEQQLDAAPEETEEAVEEQPATVDPLGDPLNVDWSTVDEEIQEAIPGETPSGYTDELRELGQSGVEPFAFGETPAEDVIPDETAEPELDGDVEELEFEVDETPEVAPIPEEEPETDFDDLTSVWGEEDSHDFETVMLSDDAVDTEPEDELDGEYEPPPFEISEETADLEEPVEAEGLADFEYQLSDEDVVVGFEPEAPPPDDEFGPRQESDIGVSMERLGLDDDLVSRARAGKADLVAQGRISGSERLPGAAPSIEELQAAVDAEPENVDHRIALASALVDVEADRALEQYRWLYRNAGDRGEEILGDLIRLAETAREQEVSAHRLVAAIYRRHGDWLAAASHYEESLVAGRRS